MRRTVGLNGTRLSAVLDGEIIGYIEVGIRTDGERLTRHAGWADVGNLHVSEGFRRRKVATWLLGEAVGWLELAHVDRLLDYTYLDGADATGQTYDDYRAFLEALPFTMLTRTRRGWTRTSQNQLDPGRQRRPAVGPRIWSCQLRLLRRVGQSPVMEYVMASRWSLMERRRRSGTVG